MHWSRTHADLHDEHQLEASLRTPVDLARPSLHNGLLRAPIPLVASPSRPLPGR